VNCYPFIEAEKAGRRDVARACALLKVSRAACCQHLAGPSRRDRADAELTDREWALANRRPCGSDELPLWQPGPVDTRSGWMILNGSSQQCPRSWTMTQQWRGVDRLDECCSHRSRISSGALRGSAACTDAPAGLQAGQTRRPRNHRKDDIGRSGPGAHVCHDAW